LRTCAVAELWGSCNLFLRGGARFCCDGLPTAGLRGQNENRGKAQLRQWLT
jgi:hypothetical protein